jgi:hypothetical protein
MTTITLLTALTLVTGFGAQEATTRGGDGSGSPASNVEANLARLRALHLFKVGNLENQIPAQADCQGSSTHIGQACPDHEQEFAAGKAAAEEGLASFVARAESTASTTKQGPAQGPQSVEKNLAALRALAIVEIGAFEADPAETASCYSHPAYDHLFTSLGDRYPVRALHHTALNVGSLEPYARAELLDSPITRSDRR